MTDIDKHIGETNMSKIYAKAIEKSDNYVEFVLFEQGQ